MEMDHLRDPRSGIAFKVLDLPEGQSCDGTRTLHEAHPRIFREIFDVRGACDSEGLRAKGIEAFLEFG
jgi:hypothetical protein